MRNPVDFGSRSLTAALATALVLSVVLAADSVMESRPLSGNKGYAPEQPISYSHRLHAGELSISCLYCHSGAERSKTAGIPPLSTCMNCHAKATSSFLASKAEAESAQKEGRPQKAVFSDEIRKIYDALALDETGVPIPGKNPPGVKWNKVHFLADFAVFDHRPHVAAGVACQSCHGPVETMEKMRQDSSLSMGWCVDCHRRSKVETPHSRGALSKNSAPSTDCRTCHY